MFMYHVDLELTDEQVRQLRQRAFDRGISVRGLVTQLAIKEIQKDMAIQKSKKQKEDTKS